MAADDDITERIVARACNQTRDLYHLCKMYDTRLPSGALTIINPRATKASCLVARCLVCNWLLPSHFYFCLSLSFLWVVWHLGDLLFAHFILSLPTAAKSLGPLHHHHFLINIVERNLWGFHGEYSTAVAPVTVVTESRVRWLPSSHPLIRTS